MRSILLEVNHPGQVHLFKYIYKELLRNSSCNTKENNSMMLLSIIFLQNYW